MISISNDSTGPVAEDTSKPFRTARQTHWLFIWIYIWGSCAAVAVTFFLAFVGFEFGGYQWLLLVFATPAVMISYIVPDIYMIGRHYAPIRKALRTLDTGQKPSNEDASAAIVRTLNLPFYSFLRVTLFHGPAASLTLGFSLMLNNWFFDAGFLDWQILGFMLTVFFFAAPAHAIFEFFAIAKYVIPIVERLWIHCERIEPEHQKALISIRLRNKLLYLSIFITALPLLFFAASIPFKVDIVLAGLAFDITLEQLTPLLTWVVGVVVVCMGGALSMSALTASEVLRSASQLVGAMQAVENGDLGNDLSITGTDEYAELFRGFNLMVSSLREEVQILELSHDLAGELNLDVLLGRIMGATTELLDADRSTLFLLDKKTGDLFSRIAGGLEIHEIRIPTDTGIAGAVFQSQQLENIDEPYDDPRFNRDVDQSTGYQTKSILAMPIINKSGDCIGVTQVLNKHGGRFQRKDESRLGAFTAQIAVALENAQLFEDVLNEKNYNDGILRSTSDGIITLDTGNKILTANDAALGIIRMDRSSVVNQPADELFTGANRWVLNNVWRVNRTQQREIAVEMELELDEGEPASVNLAVNPLIDVNEENIGSMIVLEDITSEKRVKSTMARYMSAEVAEQLLAEGESVLGGKNQNVSVLFSDVRGFTTISEALGARETVSMLNEYFEEMVDVIFRHHGVLDKFIGDAIMALFGVPFNGEHDADDAVVTANDMFTALSELNRRRTIKGKDLIRIGVGISTGEVIVGNIGSTKRMEYTVIGDAVNLGARLEGATKFYGCNILISEFTKNQLTNGHLVREIDRLQVKGKNEPVAIYEALDHFTEDSFPGLEKTVQAYGAGLGLYRQRDFQGALDSFRQGLSFHPGDKPTRIYAERCEHYIQNPPDDTWDGVWVMTTK